MTSSFHNVGVQSGLRKWGWRLVALAGLAGALAAGAWLTAALVEIGSDFFQQPLNEQSARAGVASMLLALAGLGISVSALVVALLQLRQASRSRQSVTSQVQREQQALDRLREHLGRQTRLPRMGDPDTQALGLRVHPAIDLPSSVQLDQQAAADGLVQRPVAGWRRLSGLLSYRARQRLRLDRNLPLFVDRELAPELRAWMGTARDSGGFLILVGNSSVGKTRLLYETARQVLPDFAVLAPDLGDGQVVNQLAAASFPLPRLLVWLDELQRFLDGSYLTPGSTAITAATVRRLLDAPTPVVIVGTLWPEYASALRTSDPDPATGQSRPRYPNAVDILDGQRVREVALRTFSALERQAATRMAATDPRLATALADRDYNVTEVLAGARELVRRYERGTREQQAVVEAAVDARRLGIQAPLTEQLLRTAAGGYLSGSSADNSWFGPVLSELSSDRRPQDRATAPLIQVSGPDQSRVVGYTVADYLLQRLARQRRAVRISATTWQAFIGYTKDHEDQLRLADSAERRLFYGLATSLFRQLAEAGDGAAAIWLAGRLLEQGRIDDATELLRTRADNGDDSAAMRLAQILGDQGRFDDTIDLLRAHPDLGDGSAATWLVGRLLEQRRIDDATQLLRERADAGDRFAAKWLTEQLVKQGRIDELHRRADAGDGFAADWLIHRLTAQGRVDEAIQLVRARPGVADGPAAVRLAERLAKHGRINDAIQLLRIRANAGDWIAAERLAERLTWQGRIADAIESLLLRVNAGDTSPSARLTEQLARLLAENGRIDDAIELLRPKADAGDESVAIQLAALLDQHDRIDELRARADGGDKFAADRLPEVVARLISIGDAIELLRTRPDVGGWISVNWLTDWLTAQRRLDDAIELLQVRTQAGDWIAAKRLVELLTGQGRLDDALELLLARANVAGDWDAAWKLTEQLTAHGRIDDAIQLLRARADAGDWLAAGRLTDMLAKQDRIDELRTEVDAGTLMAGARLIAALTKRGQSKQAEQLRQWGFNPDGSIASAGDVTEG